MLRTSVLRISDHSCRYIYLRKVPHTYYTILLLLEPPYNILNYPPQNHFLTSISSSDRTEGQKIKHTDSPTHQILDNSISVDILYVYLYW